MTLALPNDITNSTPADAVELQQNFTTIEAYVNSELIHRDGSVAMAAPLQLVGSPTQPLHASTKAYVDALLPVGIMVPYGGAAAPAGSWALCNGAAVSTSTYPALFAVLGYKFGGAGGTFNLPNFQGKFPIGVDTTDARFDVVGETGGTFDVPVPQHSHPMPHTHEHVHTHPIDHNHAAFDTLADGAHTHQLRFLQVNPGTLGSGGGFLAGRIDEPLSGTFTLGTTTAPVHNHTVDIPNFSGTSGAASDATTGGSSAANTSNAGTAGATMVQPYLAVLWIIRTA